MKKIVTYLFCLVALSTASAQRQSGLLWKITGNGLTKPSYVYGTMHVSSKVAFHLGDEFFKALQSCDIVALEQNLDSVYVNWLESGMFSRKSTSHGSNTLDVESFETNEYSLDDMGLILQRGPSLSNQIMFRTEDGYKNFEEETYLDMLIYRLGKKYKKYVTGVEDFMETERLTTLAAAKDVTRKNASRGSDMGETLRDFYRNGDITAIDSLNKVTYTENYNEYMLWRRNHLMVTAMEKLMKRGSLFCGVGCAHLPGDEGVIRLLEKMGYKVEVIKSLAKKPSKYLAKSKKIKVTTPVSLRTSDDNFFSASVPGSIVNVYRRSKDYTIYLSLDLPAGGQYLVYRTQDFPKMRNTNNKAVLERLDSFLYEIIPGNIDNKKSGLIENDPNLGIETKGFDIHFTNAEGDKGHYKIIHTGRELMIIAVTGIGDFAEGKEAEAFFSSFKINNATCTGLKKIASPDLNFVFEVPAGDDAPKAISPFRPDDPEFNYGRSFQDKEYMVLYRNMISGLTLHSDTSELLLSCESFAFNNNYSVESGEYKSYGSYPARYTVMKDDKDNLIYVRAVLKGRKYFLQALKTKEANPFENSFFTTLTVQNYATPGAAFDYTDTFAKFSAKVFSIPSRDKSSLQFEIIGEESSLLENKYFSGNRRQQWFSSVNENEYIEVNYRLYGRYETYRDSNRFWKNLVTDIGNTKLQVLSQKKSYHSYGTQMDVVMGDTGCSRRVLASYYLHDNEFHSILGFYDTVSGIGNFTKTFFETFTPTVTKSNSSVFSSKVPLWVEDINSSDSTIRKKAWNGFDGLYVDSNHAYLLAKVYDTLHTSQKLVEKKQNLISRIGYAKSQNMIPVLADMYRRAGDTAAFQTSILRALGALKSKASYAKLKELLFEETPVPGGSFSFNIKNALNDSLALATSVFPELFDLMNIEDYKSDIIELAAELSDSNLLPPTLYKSKVNTILTDANIVLKKALSKEASTSGGYSYDNNAYQVRNYCKLLLPFAQEEKGVQNFLEKVKTMKSRENKLKNYVLLLDKKYAVEDSVFENLAGERNHKVDLFVALDKINRLDKFPAKYKVKSTYTKDAYFNYKSDAYINGVSTVIDTILVVDSALVNYLDDKELKTGYVYFLKFNRKMKKNKYDHDEDNGEKENDPNIAIKKQYYYVICGPQPAAKDSFSGRFFTLRSDKEIAEDKEFKKEKVFKKLVRRSQIIQIREYFYGQPRNFWNFGG